MRFTRDQLVVIESLVSQAIEEENDNVEVDSSRVTFLQRIVVIAQDQILRRDEEFRDYQLRKEKQNILKAQRELTKKN